MLILSKYLSGSEREKTFFAEVYTHLFYIKFPILALANLQDDGEITKK